MSSGRVLGRSRSRCSILIDGRRMSASSVTAVGEKPFSTMICGCFSLSRPSPSNVLELLSPVLHRGGSRLAETILQRMVAEAALQRPGQLAVLSRMYGLKHHPRFHPRRARGRRL
jgi:hypothetical protein